MTTRATTKPVVRLVDAGPDGDLVLEVTDRTCVLKPPRVRNPDARVELLWGTIYRLALLRRDR